MTYHRVTFPNLYDGPSMPRQILEKIWLQLSRSRYRYDASMMTALNARMVLVQSTRHLGARQRASTSLVRHDFNL